MFFYAFHCILCIVLLQEQDSDFFLYTELKNNNKKLLENAISFDFANRTLGTGYFYTTEKQFQFIKY